MRLLGVPRGSLGFLGVPLGFLGLLGAPWDSVGFLVFTVVFQFSVYFHCTFGSQPQQSWRSTVNSTDVESGENEIRMIL